MSIKQLPHQQDTNSDLAKDMSVRGSDGLIVPRKMANPGLECNSLRDLNRQIKWNAKAGVNVLNKTELERVMEKQRRLRADKEKEAEADVQPESAFKKVLAERAKRLEEIEKETTEEQVDLKSPGLKKKTPLKPIVASAPNQIQPALEETSREVRKPNLSKTTLNPRLVRSHTEKTPSRGLAGSKPANKPVTGGQFSGGIGMSASMYNSPTIPAKVSSPRRVSAFSKALADNVWESTPVAAADSVDSGGLAAGRPSSKNWEGNSSGSSSKSSSPEPEFFKVFAQLRGNKVAEN